MSDAEFKKAIEVVLSWVGNKRGEKISHLPETPDRVLSYYKEIFSGYDKDPQDVLEKNFNNHLDGYKEAITMKDIDFVSTCEHHLLPIIGTVSISYIPDKKIIGISKLARIVDIYSKRLQMQERLTANIANSIQKHLNPKGVAVFIKAQHFCMSIRGVNKNKSYLETYHFTKKFEESYDMKKEFISNTK